MNLPENVYQKGVIGIIEQFTFADEALRQYVVYTYYDQQRRPLYIGASKDFYNAHYLNSQRLSFWDEVEFVGFYFFECEEDIKEARKYFIKIRNPLYNKHKYESLKLLADMEYHLSEDMDDLVVWNDEMMERWREFLE